MKRVTKLAELRRLVAKGETEQLELKRSTAELREGFQDFCSLLNHKGGALVFGVKPDGTIVGQQVSDKTLRDMSDQVVMIEPAVNPEHVKVRVENDRYVLVVHADADPGGVPYTYDGRPWERVGTTSRKMRQPRYSQLLQRRHAVASHWESQPADGIGPKDVDLRQVRTVARIAKHPDARTATSAQLLRAFGLLEGRRLLQAGAVAFARDVLPSYPQCKLRLVRFEGRAAGDTGSASGHPPGRGHPRRGTGPSFAKRTPDSRWSEGSTELPRGLPHSVDPRRLA